MTLDKDDIAAIERIIEKQLRALLGIAPKEQQFTSEFGKKTIAAVALYHEKLAAAEMKSGRRSK